MKFTKMFLFHPVKVILQAPPSRENERNEKLLRIKTSLRPGSGELSSYHLSFQISLLLFSIFRTGKTSQSIKDLR